MKTHFIFLLCISALTLSAQDIKPVEKLLLGDTLLFLGTDLGVAKMVNPSDMNQAVYIRDKHGPWWSGVGQSLCASNNMKFDFEKKYVLCMASVLDSSYSKLDSDWIVSKYNGLADDQITQHVKAYPSFPGYKVGFVFIIDAMDKKKNTLSMYGVYIDLSDNSVIKTIKCYGTPGGFGYSRFWTSGIEAAYTYFTTENHNYIHRIRHHFKKK